MRECRANLCMSKCVPDGHWIDLCERHTAMLPEITSRQLQRLLALPPSRHRNALLDYEAIRALHLMSNDEGFITDARYHEYADAAYRKLERLVGETVALFPTDKAIEQLEAGVAWQRSLGLEPAEAA